MYIERTFVLDGSLPEVWTFLNDPHEVGKCLPGCHTVEILGVGKYKGSVGIKVGPIKAGFDVQVETTEERPPEYAVYAMRGSDKEGGSKISAECTLALRDVDGAHTEITYTSKVNIVGKLGKFASGVMQKFADGINDQFIAAMTKRAGELHGVPEADEADKGAKGVLGNLKSMFKKQPAEAAAK
ncbi:hypothetical protein B9N43_02440 [Denitratisoma sp. DHT3]|uniref:CoxG family protein n=1 Tax=Denitratisoma sp. DHT3 TaxID=1981880 RepID=UPI0011983B73|nr:SRPBCC domain-containing protein [Denitratisoma sp. DHT3]QDX80219.1 hypothetical protein B9N43_02440 [Denitratisoma sp. DHT3]